MYFILEHAGTNSNVFLILYFVANIWGNGWVFCTLTLTLTYFIHTFISFKKTWFIFSDFLTSLNIVSIARSLLFS